VANTVFKPVYLITGRPGTGKTSLIRQAVAETGGRAGGFYTEEIRSQGVREGFKLVTLDGKEALLAHINIRSPYRVGKYGVDAQSLDRIGVSALLAAGERCELVVIDEIGKMELFSDNFRRVVSRLIESGQRILGTIMLNPNPWADAIKRRPEVTLVTVTRANHQEVRAALLGWLKTAGTERTIDAK